MTNESSNEMNGSACLSSPWSRLLPLHLHILLAPLTQETVCPNDEDEEGAEEEQEEVKAGDDAHDGRVHRNVLPG